MAHGHAWLNSYEYFLQVSHKICISPTTWHTLKSMEQFHTFAVAAALLYNKMIFKEFLWRKEKKNLNLTN